jgi:hypothetical protein
VARDFSATVDVQEDKRIYEVVVEDVCKAGAQQGASLIKARAHAGH